jgi:hypothetical protein
VNVGTAFNQIDRVYGTYGAAEKTYRFCTVKPGGERLIGGSRFSWETILQMIFKKQDGRVQMDSSGPGGISDGLL